MALSVMWHFGFSPEAMFAEAVKIKTDLALKDAQMQPGGTLRLALPLRYTDANGTQRDNTLTLDASVDQAVVLRADLPEQADGIEAAVRSVL